MTKLRIKTIGKGLNLQSCSDCVVLERQWKPANEKQAEARFIRIGAKTKYARVRK